jgi:hypothetical protein
VQQNISQPTTQPAAGRLVLWRTDGTAKGTFRLAIIGRAGSSS